MAAAEHRLTHPALWWTLKQGSASAGGTVYPRKLRLVTVSFNNLVIEDFQRHHVAISRGPEYRSRFAVVD
jgi:hypothetical protein